MVILVIVLSALAVLWLLSGVYFYNITLTRRLTRPYFEEVTGEPETDEAKEYAAWLAQTPHEDVTVTSRDGINLAAWAFVNDGGDRWVVAVHGYAMCKEGMLYAAQRFYERGFSVLVPDLRAHGISGGKHIGMGWLDRLDVADWTVWIENNYPDCKTALFGISMGAATVTMASGETLPDSVKAIVADCGFTSAADEFAYQAERMFRLPPWLSMPPFTLIARITAGYDVYAASSVKQLKKGGDLPFLLFHGEDDDFVPFYMAQKIKDAAGERARLITVPGAGHGAACLKYPLYWETVFEFIENYI